MSRPPKTPVEPADSGFSEERLQEAGEAAAQLGQLQSNYAEGRDLANQLLGQVQMANAFSSLAGVMSLSKLKFIKENKLYLAFDSRFATDKRGEQSPTVGDSDGFCRAIGTEENKLYQAFEGKLPTDNHGERSPTVGDRVGTWDGFCRALGTSANKVNEDLLNLKEFGEEAMENLTRIGAGYREMRQYRRLPDDQKVALIEAAKSGDKDSFIDLAEEIIARHGKEKEALNLSLSGKSELLERKQNMIDLQATQIDELGKKARFIATASPSEKLQGIRSELLEHALDVESTLVGKLRPAFAKLKEHLDEHGGECDAYLSGALGQIERAVRELREDYGLLRAEDVAPWANAD